MCEIRKYVYSLKVSVNTCIPCFSQRIREIPEIIREYTYTLIFDAGFYTHSLTLYTHFLHTFPETYVISFIVARKAVVTSIVEP